MTDLEALKIVREALRIIAEGRSLAGDWPRRAWEAHEALQLLAARLGQAEADPSKTLLFAENTMRDLGEVVLSTASSEQVREILHDNGLGEFADRLTDATIGRQLQAVLGKCELPMGFADWRTELEWAAAERLAEANGLKFEE